MLLRLSQYQKNILALTSSHMLAEPSQLKKICSVTVLRLEAPCCETQIRSLAVAIESLEHV